MNKVDYSRTEVLFSSSNTVITKATRNSDNKALLIKKPANAFPSLRVVESFKKDFHTTQTLHQKFPKHFINMIEMVEQENGSVFLVEEQDGDSLSNYLKNNTLGTEEFLKLAISMTKALNECHSSQILHRDIKLANFILGREEEVKLIDFGLSVIVSNKAPSISCSSPTGTYFYMSPEATSRISKNMDLRSDIYSLGITFYEMLTGTVPFKGDKLSVVHSQITKKVPFILEAPNAINVVIQKMCQKSPTDRYSSAYGVLRDLEFILKKLDSLEEDFEPGKDDLKQFQIPNNIYGREEELKLLCDVIQSDSTDTRMCLISGYSGSGKSKLIEELIKRPEMNVTISYGKFDQFNRTTPYFAFINVVKSLILRVLSEEDEYKENLKNIMKLELKENAGLISQLVPELKVLLGEQKVPVSLDRSEETQKRLFETLFSFFNCFTGDNTLIIAIDDLQWADSASFVLLNKILQKNDPKIFVLGAYRDNEVDSGHQLSILLKEFQNLKIINIQSLNLEYLNQMVADTLGQKESETIELSRLIHLKTNGNPFFSREFLNTLYEEELIKLEEKEWIYDLDSIKKMNFSSNVIDFMIENLLKTPKMMQNFLNKAAYFGDTFKLTELHWIWDEKTSVQATLIEPLQDGWIIQIDSDRYKFFHDRLRQAAYEIAEEKERKNMHLVIGTTLLNKLKDSEELENGIFDVVNHLNIAKDLFEDQITLINLNLIASKKSLKNSAFSAAVNFSEIAMEALTEDVWSSDYSLARRAHVTHAESCFGATRISESEKLYQILLENSNSNVEKFSVYKDYMKMSVLSFQFDRSYDLLMNAFQLFTLTKDIPLNDPVAYKEWIYDFKKKIDVELVQIGGVKGIEKIKQCNDKEMAAFSILLTESLDTIFVSGKTNPLMPVTVSLISLYLHLTEGLTENAPVSFGISGWMICSFFQDPMGYQLTNLAEKLLEKTKNPNFNEALVRFTIGINQIFGGTFKQGLYHFSTGSNYAIAHGEYVFGCYNMNNWGMRAVTNGENFFNVISKLEVYQSFCKKIGNIFVRDLLECDLHFAQDLAGIRKFNPKYLLEGIKEANWAGSFFIFMEAMVAYHNGEIEKAKGLLDEREPRLVETIGHCGYYASQCYHALCCAHFYKKTGEQIHLTKFESFVELFKSYNVISPFYYGPMYQLLCAVSESFKQNADTLSVLNLFNKSSESAQKYGLPIVSAVINELMLDYCIEKNFLPAICQYYFEKLISIWESMAAASKVSKLKKKYSKFNLIASRKHNTSSSDLTTSSSNSSSTSSFEEMGSDSLDMMSIIKASQALSVELTTSNLIKKVLFIIKENTGAENVLIILKKGKEFKVTSSINKKGNLKEMDQNLKEYDQYCSALVDISIAMKKQIILNNARQSEYSENSYIKKNGIKSLFIHPILKKNELVGLIYMENKSLEGIFNNNRKVILEHIGSQLSISYENATLYDEMNSLNKSYERFLPKQFLDQLGKGDVRNIKRGDAATKNMSVMFSDIRNFTDLTENMNPEESFSFVNGILSYLAPVISKNNGFIDKFFGDCIMALFPNAIDDSIKCGFEMLEALKQYNIECRKDQSKVSIGVGIHYGDVMVGTIGDNERIDATVISDTVNTASRVESLTKTLGATFVVTEDLLVGSKLNFKSRFIGKYLLKGKKNPISLFQMLNDQNTKHEDFKKALHLFESRKFHQAKEIFSQLKEYDFTSKYLDNVSSTYENYNFPDSWAGEIQIDKDGKIIPLNLDSVIEKEIDALTKENQMKLLEKLVNEDKMKNFLKVMSFESPEEISSLVKQFTK